MKNAAPLPHEWMIASIIGFFVSWLYIYGDLGLGEGYTWAIKWGVTFMLFFIIIFIATIVSMSSDRIDEDHLDELAIHKKG